MALRTWNGIELCAGVGWLGLGIECACEFLGIDYRTVCYVERDTYAASVIVARMADAALGQALVWDDLATFDGRPWRGRIHCLSAGLPCPAFSVAGKGLGLADERAWGSEDSPIPQFLRIVGEVEPALVFIENVPPFISGGHFRLVGERLCAMGYEIETPLFLRASDVGASHKRERVFILAHARISRSDARPAGVRPRDDTAGEPSNDLAHPGGQLAEPTIGGLGELRQLPERDGQPDGSDELVGEPTSRGRGGELVALRGIGGADEHALEYANAIRGRKLELQPDRQAGFAESAGVGIFAPGPGDPRWGAILRDAPWLAPALNQEEAQSVFRRVAYGFLNRLDGGALNEQQLLELRSLVYFAPIGQRQVLLKEMLRRIQGEAAAQIKSCFAQESPASSFSRWKDVQQMRLSFLLGPSPRGLQQGNGCSDSLPEVSPQAGYCGGQAGDGSDGQLFDMRNGIQAEQEAAQHDLQQSGMSEGTRQDQREEAMGLNMKSRADQLRCAGNGVVPIQTAVAFVELVRSTVLQFPSH